MSNHITFSDAHQRIVDTGLRYMKQKIARLLEAEKVYDRTKADMLHLPSDVIEDALKEYAERVRLAGEAKEHAELMVNASLMELYDDWRDLIVADLRANDEASATPPGAPHSVLTHERMTA